MISMIDLYPSLSFVSLVFLLSPEDDSAWHVDGISAVPALLFAQSRLVACKKIRVQDQHV